ncbi:molybdenum cofactor synthesis 2 [Coprinopsis cinerea AmutBmut pab1-1]|nr:molybdenum cofactor synthesis 2 [Coprinopsis cinerea AmutBmut pab1-1]
MQGLLHSASTDARLELAEGICVLTYSKLIVEDITNIVRDDGAGAIAVFIGKEQGSGLQTLNLTIHFCRNNAKFIQRKGSYEAGVPGLLQISNQNIGPNPARCSATVPAL